MSNPIYPVLLHPDVSKALKLKSDVASASTTVKLEILHLTGMMEQGLIASRDRYELLDGWLETYGLYLGGTSRRLLCDFDILTCVWHMLALSNGPDFKNEAFRETCSAHGLTNPTRVP